MEHRSFHEPFVLKTYQSRALGDTKSRFLKEAQTWVQLGSHPNIVRCLWVNEIDCDLYVAAEYVPPDEDGFSTLEDRLRLGKIPFDKQFRWSAEFCFAMRHARKKGSTALGDRGHPRHPTSCASLVTLAASRLTCSSALAHARRA